MVSPLQAPTLHYPGETQEVHLHYPHDLAGDLRSLRASQVLLESVLASHTVCGCKQHRPDRNNQPKFGSKNLLAAMQQSSREKAATHEANVAKSDEAQSDQGR